MSAKQQVLKACTTTHIIASLLQHLDAILKRKAQVLLLVLEWLKGKLLSYQLKVLACAASTSLSV